MYESQMKKLFKAKKYQQAYGVMIEEAVKEREGQGISVDALLRGKDLIDVILRNCGDDPVLCSEGVLALFSVDFPSGLSSNGAPKTAEATQRAAQASLTKPMSLGLILGVGAGILLLSRLGAKT